MLSFFPQLNILSSFEDRLCKLQDTILPVHKETTDLQRRQESIFSNVKKTNHKKSKKRFFL